MFQTVTTILFSICIAGCKPVPKTETGAERKNIYELLIASSSRKVGDEYCQGNITVHLSAVEYDKNRVLRQRYYDFDYMGRNILEEGWRKHEHTLKSPHGHSILRKDFDRFQYWDYNADITGGAGAIFPSGSLMKEYSWTIDSIPLDELTERTVVLLDPDYELHLDNDIAIPHACRLATETIYNRGVHVFVYDRDRQMTVAAELRDACTNEIRLKYELIKVIEMTRNDFYEFWTEPEEYWDDMEILLPDPDVYLDNGMDAVHSLDFLY